MKWRPENWTYGDGYSKPQRKCLHGKGRVRAFEAGADAMLEALRNRRKYRGACYQENGKWISDPMIVDIPDDPRPSEKPAEPQLYICSAGYPNCAFCDIKEPHPHSKGCDIDCLNGKTCVPYVPEKCVDVTYEHLREKLGKYKYGLR